MRKRDNILSSYMRDGTWKRESTFSCRYASRTRPLKRRTRLFRAARAAKLDDVSRWERAKAASPRFAINTISAGIFLRVRTQSNTRGIANRSSRSGPSLLSVRAVQARAFPPETRTTARFSRVPSVDVKNSAKRERGQVPIGLSADSKLIENANFLCALLKLKTSSNLKQNGTKEFNLLKQSSGNIWDNWNSFGSFWPKKAQVFKSRIFILHVILTFNNQGTIMVTSILLDFNFILLWNYISF